MIRSLAALFMHEGSKVERACVVSDARGGEYFDELAAVLDELERRRRRQPRAVPRGRRAGRCSTRYKETRRRHPLAPHGNVADGDRGASARCSTPIRDARRRGHRHDRPDRVGAAAQARVRDARARRSPGRLAVTFASFGHKHGPPRDADLVLDVRFLPNPHWEPDLRPLTGFDPRVIEYVGRDGRLRGVLRRACAAARLPAPAVRRRGQVAPRGGDRLHRRPAPLGRRRRGARRALPRRRALRRRGRRTATSRRARRVACDPRPRRFAVDVSSPSAGQIPFPAPPLRFLRKGFASPCQYASASTASAASAATSSAPRTSRRPTSRSSPSTTSPTTRPSRTCSSTTPSSAASRARSRSAATR